MIPAAKGSHYGWPYCYTPGLGANLPPEQRQHGRDERLALPPGCDCSQAAPALFTDLATALPWV